MIVVVGSPAWREAEPPGPAGRAAAVAHAAAAAGARVELVGRAGDDDVGDALVLALAAAGVGHVALLRDPARATPLVDDAPLDGPADQVTATDAGAQDPAAGSRTTDPVLEPADVAMALRYLTEYAVLVLTDGLAPDAVAVGAEAAAYASAHLVVLVGEDAAVPHGLPGGATVLAAPAIDPDDAFAGLVGRYAAALDRGDDPRRAFADVTSGSGWERAPG